MPRARFKCRRCSQYRFIEEFVGGGPVEGYCHECWSWNAIEIARIRGITGCCDCQLTFERLKAIGRRMFLVPKDGIYQILCQVCNDRWELLVKEMFKATRYGRGKGLT